MPGKTVLIVGNLSARAEIYAAHLERAGHVICHIASGAQALARLSEGAQFGAVLWGMRLADGDGLALLRAHPDLLRRQRVIVAVPADAAARGAEAMRLGAFDFLIKPMAAKRLITLVEAAIQAGPAPLDNTLPAYALPAMSLGQSPAMVALRRQLANVAASRAGVLITGEAGSGKEHCASEIHHASGRGDRPFVAVHCASQPEAQLDAELFGHTSGHGIERPGAIQNAHLGTLFLNEVCDLPPNLQLRLLRFLQTYTVDQPSALRTIDVDVRVLCSTSRDPAQMVAQGRLRADLLERLDVIRLAMPPLRQRREDAAMLAQTFLDRFAAEEGKRFAPLGPQHIAAIEGYDWPGNLRELRSVLRRAVLMHAGGELPLRCLPARHAERPDGAAGMGVTGMGGEPCGDPERLARAMAGMTLDEIERIAIEAAIETAGGSLPAAARALGVSPSTLYRKRDRWINEALTG
ncbi:response regulator [Novosphingobium sp. FSY-8]|uniref:Response regulator n=1 Tax=Novosphingobium ovatum TaxID=1908523 RepID=A0ABW9X916_9SPHN|nr:sigma-54 dependent transcriptional regulator [Novosphingobium ovatum]NBC35022.1 response regulator [Novosphingobium ovatum]